jgi:hypothetical protein
MGRVQDTRPFEKPAENDQQERRREGGEDSGEDGQKIGLTVKKGQCIHFTFTNIIINKS